RDEVVHRDPRRILELPEALEVKLRVCFTLHVPPEWDGCDHNRGARFPDPLREDGAEEQPRWVALCIVWERLHAGDAACELRHLWTHLEDELPQGREPGDGRRFVREEPGIPWEFV